MAKDTAPGYLRWRRTVWIVVPYALALWWVHHMVRDPFNVDYLQRYVSLRCSAGFLDAAGRSEPPENLAELEQDLRRCQGLAVEIDGVWGGAWGRASVRLRVAPSDTAPPVFKYYAVDVTPLLGTISVAYEITPWLYYLNV